MELSFQPQSAGPNRSAAATKERQGTAALQNLAERQGTPTARQRPGVRLSSAAFASAFTLLEVMIACGIFFIAVFAILALVSNTLRNARSLRRVEVDAGMVAAQLFKTNRLNQGTESGDFGDIFPDYSWETVTDEAFPYTNGLWQVDIIVRRRGKPDPVDSMSVWVYSPDSRSTRPAPR